MTEKHTGKVINTPARNGSSRSGSSGSTREGASGNKSGRRRRVSQRLLLATGLGLAVAVIIVESVLFGTHVINLNKENSTLRSDLHDAKVELSKLLPEIKKTRQELDGAIQGRMPHLRALEPDKVLTIGDGYVKNIMFSVLNVNSKNKYEYKLVMENTSNLLVRPQVQIFVFNSHGVQIGMAENNERLDLTPGESRSRSSDIRLFIKDEPRYFFIHIPKES